MTAWRPSPTQRAAPQMLRGAPDQKTNPTRRFLVFFSSSLLGVSCCSCSASHRPGGVSIEGKGQPKEAPEEVSSYTNFFFEVPGQSYSRIDSRW